MVSAPGTMLPRVDHDEERQMDTQEIAQKIEDDAPNGWTTEVSRSAGLMLWKGAEAWSLTHADDPYERAMRIIEGNGHTLSDMEAPPSESDCYN
jgi:hypothetical protein